MKISQKAESFRKNRIRRHAWQRVVFAAACVVVFCTVYALILPAITMEEDVFCGIEEHTHGEECYQQNLICTLEEGVEPHIHDESCYEVQSTLACTLPEEEGHTHTDTCYDPENPEVLICTLEETPGHTHTEECYTTEQILICTLEEGLEPHTHSEECYESVLICEQEEHTHSLLCYSNPKADVEKPSQWERTLPDNLSGNWSEDIIAIAQSQLGYTESSKNYTLAEDGSKKGYTRYGDWYGNPCGEWCAMFVSFCSHYAGIPQEAMLYEMSCLRMVNNLISIGVFHEAAGYTPQPGDIVFFQWEGSSIPSHVGIVAETGDKLITIEGNHSDKVDKGSYEYEDPNILGYASMAEIMDLYWVAPTAEPVEETPEATVEPENTPEPTAEQATVEETPEATPEPSIEPTVEPAVEPSIEPSVEPTLEPTAEPAIVPTLALAEPHLVIVSSEEDTAIGTDHAYAERGETVYFRAFLLQPEDTAVESSAENMDIPEGGEEVANQPTEEESTEPVEVAQTTPLRITLPYTSGLFDWRLEDTNAPGAVWVICDGTTTLLTDENDRQYLEISQADSAIITLTLPAGEVYSAFANGLANRAETTLAYEDQQTTVVHTLIPDDPACGLTAHTHSNECYGEEGELTCTLTEHQHTEFCFFGYESSFSYEDSELAMSIIAYSREPLLEGTVLTVEPLEDEEVCLRYAEFAQTLAPEEGASLLLRKVYLTANGEALPEDAYGLVASVQVSSQVTAPMVALLDEEETETPADKGFMLTAMLSNETGISEGDTVLAALGDDLPALTVTLQNGELALLASTTANPTYTVQYYAWIPRFASSGDKSITVFDTSGGVLPKNNQTNTKKNLYLNAQGSKYVFATVDTLTQTYLDNTFEYIKAPNPSYINKLLDNASYVLDKIWVLKSGGDKNSTDESNWDIYDPDFIHFTNRKDIEDASKGIIYLSNTSVLRMVYKVGSSSMTTPATFYDYDISTSSDSTTRFMTTGAAGINSAENYDSYGKNSWDGVNLHNTSVFAFGNSNCGTGLGYSKYQGLYLNTYSTYEAKADSYDNEGCTFNLVQNSLSNDTIQFNVLAPRIFNDGDAKGKTYFKNSSLTFTQVGDTYTLSAATVSGAKGASDLGVFFNPTCGSTTYDYIFTNNFWPMDNATGVQDFMFGNNDNPGSLSGLYSSRDYGTFGYLGAENKSLPKSDDGVDHNSFFGMQFALQFTLTEDYVGPLEYYFFGDDDLWVFLDNTLVCDIGGVHSSVGEYVNLWDYIDRNTLKWDVDEDGNEIVDEQGNRKRTFKLTFFYTERGASGSTCYMNFTLPSVSGATISQKTGSLKVEKEVVGEHEASEEFEFKINFTKADGTTAVLDDYVYDRYKADGTLRESDLIIHDNGSFKLCDGEYVIIKYLPYGVQYHITEMSKSGYTTTCTVDGVIQEGDTAHSTIIRGTTNTVTFTNTVVRKQLKLRKMWIEGVSTPITLSGVTFTLTDSSGNTVNVVDKGNGTYEVPLSSDGYIVNGAQYYIALASNPDYVISVQVATEGAELKLYKKDESKKQQWKLYRQSDGAYAFLNAATDKQLIDLDNGITENGRLVHLWGDDDVTKAHANRKWFLQPNGDGSFTIRHANSVLNGTNYVLDLDGGTVEDGQKIHLWTGNGSNAQKWVLVPVNEAEALKTVTEVVTNGDGEMTITNLIPGVYTLTEATPEGYKGMEPIKVRVSANGQLELVDDQNNGLVTVKEDGMLLEVENVPVDKKLTLTKRVQGSTDVIDFTFTVTYEKNGETVTETITLQDSESNTIEIPHGVQVTITEESHNGFTVAYSSKAPPDGKEELLSNESSYSFDMVEDVEIIAINTVHYHLPDTGGGGTQLLTTGGLLLTAGSLLFGYRKKRRGQRSSTDQVEKM